MKKKLGLLLAAAALAATMAAPRSVEASTTFRAGFGVRSIVPAPETWSQIWHVSRKHPTMVLPGDGLYARAAFLDDGATKLAIVSLDLLGFFYDDITIVRDKVRATLGQGVQVMVASTHSHSTPDALGVYGPDETTTGRNDAYNSFVVDQAAAAAIEAANSATFATVKMAQMQPPDGLNEYDRSRHPGTFDNTVSVLQFLNGSTTLGTIVNWASHPELVNPKSNSDPAIPPGNVVMSSDFVHTLRTTVETALGGVCVFLNGPNGATTALALPILDPDTNTPFPSRSVKKAYHVGTQIGQTAIDALNGAGAETVADPPLSVVSHEVFLAVDNVFLLALCHAGVIPRKLYTAGVENPLGRDVKTEMMHVTLGPLEFLTVPGEMQPDLYTGVYQPSSEKANPDVPAEQPIEPQMTKKFHFVSGLSMDELGYFVSATDYVWPSVAPLYSNGIDRNGVDHYQETLSLGRDEARAISQQASLLLGTTPEPDYLPYPAGFLSADGTAMYGAPGADVRGIWLDTSNSGRYEQREDAELFVALPSGAPPASFGFLDSQLRDIGTDLNDQVRGVWIDGDGDDTFDPLFDPHLFGDTYALGEGGIDPGV